MKFGFRMPSLKKSLKARTTGRLKRSVKKSLNPLYGKKGIGLINNPRKAVYNKIYNKTSVDSLSYLKNDSKINTSDIKDDKSISPVTPNSMKKYDNMKKSVLYDETTSWGKRNIKRDKIEHERFLLQNKYENLIQQHYKYENVIEENYKLAIYQESINNNYTKKCEEQCALDIKLSEQLIDYYKKDIELQNKAYNFGIEGLPIYPAYTRLIQLYEKQKLYIAALNICNIAIKNGYTNESGKGNVFTRKARLEKKINKYVNEINRKNNTNYKYYEDKNLIIDDNTGEIMK